MANLMPEVAALLGVEIGEKFMANDRGGNILCGIYEDGLCKLNHDGSKRPGFGDDLLGKILRGKSEIVKLPWEPKFGEPYWTISFSTNFTVRVIKKAWEKDCVDFALLRLGMVYRTMQEAADHMAEDYERLTGKELSRG